MKNYYEEEEKKPVEAYEREKRRFYFYPPFFSYEHCWTFSLTFQKYVLDVWEGFQQRMSALTESFLCVMRECSEAVLLS